MDSLLTRRDLRDLERLEKLERLDARRTTDRSRIDPYPFRGPLRWILRAALAVPFIALSIVLEIGGAFPSNSPNALRVARVQTIQWDRADVAWVGQLFPPVSTLIAAVVPGGVFGLALVGSLAAGFIVQKALQVMVQRRFAPSTAILLTAALAANPLFFYMATQNLSGFLGIAMFGLALGDVMRFVVWGNTQSGFRAGVLLMFASLTDVSGLLYVLAAGVTAPLLTLGRNGQRGARGSNVIVVVFPTVSAFVTVMFLQLVFLGNPLALFASYVDPNPARVALASSLFTSLNGFLILAPLLIAWLTSVIVRRPGAIVISAMVFVAVLGGYVIGLVPLTSAGNVYLVMTLLAVALVPSVRSKATTRILNLVVVTQLAVGWAAAYNRPVVADWMHAIGQALLNF